MKKSLNHLPLTKSIFPLLLILLPLILASIGCSHSDTPPKNPKTPISKTPSSCTPACNPTTQTCVNGTCTPKNQNNTQTPTCSAATCNPQTHECINNVCQLKTTCNPECNSQTHTCQNNKCVKKSACANITCGQGKTCNHGKCVDDPANQCANVTCDTNLECVQGKCYHPCAKAYCSKGKTCVDNDSCQDLPCNPACSNDKQCLHGKCVDLCQGQTCTSSTQKCNPFDGTCIEKCSTVTCSPTETCNPETGTCQPIPAGTCTPMDPPHYSCSGDDITGCVNDPTLGPTIETTQCPAGCTTLTPPENNYLYGEVECTGNTCQHPIVIDASSTKTYEISYKSQVLSEISPRMNDASCLINGQKVGYSPITFKIENLSNGSTVQIKTKQTQGEKANNYILFHKTCPDPKASPPQAVICQSKFFDLDSPDAMKYTATSDNESIYLTAETTAYREDLVSYKITITP